MRLRNAVAYKCADRARSGRLAMTLNGEKRKPCAMLRRYVRAAEKFSNSARAFLARHSVQRLPRKSTLGERAIDRFINSASKFDEENASSPPGIFDCPASDIIASGGRMRRKWRKVGINEAAIREGIASVEPRIRS